jgi:hypothetical protein
VDAVNHLLICGTEIQTAIKPQPLMSPSTTFTPLTGPDFGATATAPAPRYKMPSLEEQATFSEARLGQECGLWLQDFNRAAYDVFFHIPNGGLRTAVESHGFKMQHAKPGVPDYFLAWPTPDGYHHGLFIELKTKTGRVAPAQMAWHAKLGERCYRVEVVRALDEFIALLTEYLA